MGRKRGTQGFQWIREDQEGEAVTLVERRRWRDVKDEDAEVEAVVERLLSLGVKARSELPLSDELAEELVTHGKLEGTARARHFRRLKRLLRADEIEAIQAAMEQGSPRERWLQQMEGWRARILAGNDEEVQAFVDLYPSADRQVIRSLARTARGEGGVAARAASRLFQVLKQASAAMNTEEDSPDEV